MASLLNKLTGGGHSKETTENRAVPSTTNDPKLPGEYRHTGDESELNGGRPQTGDVNPVTGGGHVGGLAARTGDGARSGETGRIAEERREEGNVLGHGHQEGKGAGVGAATGAAAATGLKSGSGADIGYQPGEHNTPSNLASTTTSTHNSHPTAATSTTTHSSTPINFNPVHTASGEYVVKDSITGEPHFTNPAGYKDFGSSSTGVALEHSAIKEKLHGHGHGDVVNPGEATGVFGQRNEGHGLGATAATGAGVGGATAGVGALALGEKHHHQHGHSHPDSNTVAGGNNLGTTGTDITSGSNTTTTAKSGVLDKMGVKTNPAGGAGPGHELQEELDLHKKGQGIHENKHVEDLSTSGPHGLVLDPATGKYVHRRELDHKGSTGVPLK